MRRFFQQSGLTVPPLLDAVSGIAKQNATARATQEDKQDQHQYLRLPLESARRLRWFDNVDLNQIVRTHIREKQELIDVNDRLRKILIARGCVREDVLDQEVMQRISDVDQAQVVNESVTESVRISMEWSTGVSSALLLSAEHELRTLRTKLETVDTPSRAKTSSLEDAQEEDGSVSVQFRLSEAAQRMNVAERADLKELAEENGRLREMVETMKRREKKTELPSETVTRAHNMCLKAEEQTRIAERKAEEARVAAERAEEKERAAVKEATDLAKRMKRLAELQKTLVADHKAEVDALNTDYTLKAQECQTLVQRNICLRSEMDEIAHKASGHERMLLERDALAAEVRSLKESQSELRVLAERGGHYEQITSEMEERVGKMEKELVATAQQVGTLENQLKRSEALALKEQTRSEKLERKLRQIAASEREQQSTHSDNHASLLAELESTQRALKQAETEGRELSSKLQTEQHERGRLLSDLSEMEDRLISVERQNTSATFQLRHQLSVAKKDLEECKRYSALLERERQNLCTKLHVRPDPAIGYEDSRGSGTFHDASAMTDVSSRNGLSAIDTLYLKNVLFKFIEAMAKNRSSERDMLLPAVATLLGASSEEFAKLKKALQDDSANGTKSVFGFWSRN